MGPQLETRSRGGLEFIKKTLILLGLELLLTILTNEKEKEPKKPGPVKVVRMFNYWLYRD